MRHESQPHHEPADWHRGDRVRLPDGRTRKILLTNQRAATVDPDDDGHVISVHVAETMARLTPEAEDTDWLYWGRRREDGTAKVMVVDPETGTGSPLPLRRTPGGRLHSPG